MRYLLPAAVMLMTIVAACGPGSGSEIEDDRLVVLGPSLVEIMFRAGLGDRIVGVDRYSQWPPETRDIQKVGGYLDPSLEQITALSPTSMHVSGDSPRLREIARELDIPFYTYCFDSLGGVFDSLDSLDSRYGAAAADFEEELRGTLDSLAGVMQEVVPLSVMVVIYHERGSSSMTVAGRESFFADILIRLGCSVSSPALGAWPMISAEGAVSLDPDQVICLFPGRTDSASVREWEEDFWSGLGFEPAKVHCLFDPYLMIPGARLGMTAERICSCLL
jgi:iron complex transport system substrate-binding protein